MVLGGVSGQQEYLSKVLLQTTSVTMKEDGRGIRSPLIITVTSLSLHLRGCLLDVSHKGHLLASYPAF